MAYFRTGGAGIPTALKTGMNNVLNKKFGTTGQDYNPNDWPDDVNLLGALEVKQATGAIASFSDGADDVPIADGVFNIDYTGTAVSEMTIRQTGKNLLDDTNRVIFGSIYKYNQTSATSPSLDYLPAGTYTFKPYLSDGIQLSGIIIRTVDPYETIVNDFSSPTSVTFTLTAPKKNILITLFKSSGTWSLSDVVGAQLEIGSTPTNYEPFDSVSDKTVDFDGSIYGGSYNSVTGVLTSTKASDGSDLAEPVETNIGPTAIASLLGNNNIYCDTGNTTIDYRSSGTETIIQPTLITKQITENGTYNAADDDADGFSSVTVAVPGNVPFVPTFSETLIGENTSHASTFTLSEAYSNYDLVKIVWWESASTSGFLYTTPDIIDEIFTVGVGKICINKPSTNYYVCYTKSGLTWTQTNQRNIFVHEIYGVTLTNCTMQLTDLYKREASTVTKYAITSQTSLKDYDMFFMSSIHATDGSETMPTTWLYQYPKENISGAFSCPVPCVLQEYNANDEAFVISEYGMTAARYFMVQGVKFTAI